MNYTSELRRILRSILALAVGEKRHSEHSERVPPQQPREPLALKTIVAATIRNIRIVITITITIIVPLPLAITIIIPITATTATTVIITPAIRGRRKATPSSEPRNYKKRAKNKLFITRNFYC